MTRAEAYRLRGIVEQSSASLPDREASTVPTFFPEMKYDGGLIAGGTRINWGGVVKKAAQDIWDTELNNPDNAPTLWADLNYREGYRIIPTPAGGIFPVTEAFAQGEIGWRDDMLYRSLKDGNCYTPVAHPPYWEVVQ